MYWFLFYSMLLSLLFWCSNWPRLGLQLPLWASFCVLLTCLYYSFSISLPLGAKKCFRLILYFPCPTLDSAIPSRSPSSFNYKVVFRNQDHSAGCAHCNWGVAVPRPELRNTHKYAHPFISIFVYSETINSYIPCGSSQSFRNLALITTNMFTHLLNPFYITNYWPCQTACYPTPTSSSRELSLPAISRLPSRCRLNRIFKRCHC